MSKTLQGHRIKLKRKKEKKRKTTESPTVSSRGCVGFSVPLDTLWVISEMRNPPGK